jgi:hypothetical protein
MIDRSPHRLTPSPCLPRIFLIGHPGDVGGARTEIWHTVRLWRRFGLPVVAVPTWTADPAWTARLAAIGVPTVEIRPPTCPADLDAIPGLRGSTVVSFCNAHFIAAADHFRDLGCPIVWVNCMTWQSPAERTHQRRRGPFDRYVFQSRHQAETLIGKAESGKRKAGEEKQKAESGKPKGDEVCPAFRFPLSAFPERCRLIRGAFCPEDFSFRPRPHETGQPFFVGRISRAAADKFPRNTWTLLSQIPHPLRARVMAWNAKVERKLGPPPRWAQCLPAGAEPSAEFFASLHCMLQPSGGADENWPRSGLEAMAAGVPIVAPDRWGWREMIEHGRTGLLAQNDAELVAYTARLAYDEDLRLAIAHRARRALVEELAEPEAIWGGWRALFRSLEASP